MTDDSDASHLQKICVTFFSNASQLYLEIYIANKIILLNKMREKYTWKRFISLLNVRLLIRILQID